MENKIYLKDLITKCNGILVQGNLDTVLSDFSKDTRTINKNDIYIGIKGEKIDGSIFYEEALKKGANGCILNKDVQLKEDILKKYDNAFIVLVDSTITALQELATYKRSLYDIPVIGITGSVGKTSTKDIVASIMSKKFNVLKTEGNYNNHIGLPLTILKLKNHDALVVEMGMNNLGEISLLSKIAKPTISIITNVGTAHIGILKSRENILKAKLEILDGMTKNSPIIINNDNDLLHKWYIENKNNYNIITYGIENKSDYNATNINLEELKSTFELNIKNNNTKFEINIPGEHFILNSLCAISVGDYFSIPIEELKNGLKNFELTKRRMEIENIKNITIINDCYNANLDSMKGAIKYLGTLNTRKIAILGDMLELGSFSEELHRLVGQELIQNKIDIIFLVGNEVKYIEDECLKHGFNKNNIYLFKNNKDALEKILDLIKEKDTLLIKASYSMNFIDIYNGLKEKI